MRDELRYDERQKSSCWSAFVRSQQNREDDMYLENILSYESLV